MERENALLPQRMPADPGHRTAVTAPHNRIRRLRAIEAIGALLPSCPPSFAHDETLEDAVCATVSAVVAQVPVYHLECLPDAAAAELACRTIFGGESANPRP